MLVGVVGLGVVGKAVFAAFGSKFNTIGYDKFGEHSDLESFEKILKTDVLFVCVPTPTIDGKQDLSALDDVMAKLEKSNYEGVVCVKCTVLPGTMNNYDSTSCLKLVHNPEFLTAAKPFEDFMNQKAIILSGLVNDTLIVSGIYKELLPNIPIYTYDDFHITEMAKYFSNCFLAVKVTFANEIYDICKKIGCNYDFVREATISQGLVAPNHTKVPGPDGKFGYGLGCLPKESFALQSYCNEIGLEQEVLSAAIKGNQKRRSFDNTCKEIGKDRIII